MRWRLRGFAGKRAVLRIVGAWHAGCIILGNMACFVTWEMPLLDINEPPEIVAALHDDGELVSYHEDLFFVLAARDPDSDAPLFFLWQVGNTRLYDVSYATTAGDTGDGGAIWASDVMVPWDEAYDGAELSVQVIDDGGARTRASWPLEVL
jgi:hypothetical protein